MAASSFPAAFSALRRKRPGALSSVASRILSWVVQDENDGTPNHEEIWHFDYGTSGQTSNRLTAIYNPSACSDYDESTYAVTLRTSAGLIYAVEYFTTQGLGYYAGYPKKIRIKQGTSGTLDTLIEYGRTITARPDLATSIKHYEAGSEGDGRTTNLSYTFYDGYKYQLKELDMVALQS